VARPRGTTVKRNSFQATLGFRGMHFYLGLRADPQEAAALYSQAKAAAQAAAKHAEAEGCSPKKQLEAAKAAVEAFKAAAKAATKAAAAATKAPVKKSRKRPGGKKQQQQQPAQPELHLPPPPPQQQQQQQEPLGQGEEQDGGRPRRSRKQPRLLADFVHPDAAV